MEIFVMDANKERIVNDFTFGKEFDIFLYRCNQLLLELSIDFESLFIFNQI